jgi:hypothetical protein
MNLIKDKRTETILSWILRIGVFGTFLGHGMNAVHIKPSWIVYLTAYGFSTDTAKTLMPLIGILDVIIAFIVLIYPMRIILIWAILWAFATAVTRVVAGEAIWEFVERAANWAAPLSLLLLQGKPKSWKNWFIL